MSQNFLLNASFHLLLLQIDQELANNVRQGGCGCGGRLDQADYPRSPFGLPPALRDHYQKRISLCCNDCRKRTTPPSVRFLGRRWFPAPLLLLISILNCGINARRLQQVKRHFGIVISESTWKRWRAWWHRSFMQTLFWQQSKGLIILEIKTADFMPRVLLSLFQGTLQEKLRSLLRFFAPMTSGALRAV